MCCREALEEAKIGNRFKEDMIDAISKKGLGDIDWGSGIWQNVLALKEVRRKYTHVNITQEELWPKLEVADNAIKVVREAVEDVYQRVNMSNPKWIYDDDASGWK